MGIFSKLGLEWILGIYQWAGPIALLVYLATRYLKSSNKFPGIAQKVCEVVALLSLAVILIPTLFFLMAIIFGSVFDKLGLDEIIVPSIWIATLGSVAILFWKLRRKNSEMNTEIGSLIEKRFIKGILIAGLFLVAIVVFFIISVCANLGC